MMIDTFGEKEMIEASRASLIGIYLGSVLTPTLVGLNSTVQVQHLLKIALTSPMEDTMKPLHTAEEIFLRF